MHRGRSELRWFRRLWPTTGSSRRFSDRRILGPSAHWQFSEKRFVLPLRATEEIRGQKSLSRRDGKGRDNSEGNRPQSQERRGLSGVLPFALFQCRRGNMRRSSFWCRDRFTTRGRPRSGLIGRPDMPLVDHVLLASYRQQCFWIGVCNCEQSTRGTARLLAALFPALKRAHGHTKQFGELRLG